MALAHNGLILETDELAGKKLLQMGFGRQTENGVRLHPLEAAYLVEKKLLSVSDGTQPMAAMQFLADESASKKAKPAKAKAAKSAKRPPPLSVHPLSLHDQYLLFRALRQNGQVVRFTASPMWWRVLAAGVGRDQERAQSLLRLSSPDFSASIASLEHELATARLMRLELLFGYVKDGQPHLLKVSKPPV